MPAPGWTASPAGLSITTRSSSWYSTGSRKSSGKSSAGRGSGTRTSISAPARGRSDALAAAPPTLTAPSAMSCCSRARDSSGSLAARSRSRRIPASPASTRNWAKEHFMMSGHEQAQRRRIRRRLSSPDRGLDVALAREDDVDQGPLEEVRARVQLGVHAALVVRAALLDLLGEHGEERVVLDAFLDLRLVVERQVGGDGARQPVGRLGRLDQGRHGRNLPYRPSTVTKRPVPLPHPRTLPYSEASPTLQEARSAVLRKGSHCE